MALPLLERLKLASVAELELPGPELVARETWEGAEFSELIPVELLVDEALSANPVLLFGSDASGWPG